MEVNIENLVRSRDEFKFLLDRQRKVAIIKDKLDKAIDDFFDLPGDRIELGNIFLIEREIIFESMLLYINSYYDMLLLILQKELNIRIENKKMGSVEYRTELETRSEVTRQVLQYWQSSEFQLIRNAANMMKHRGIIKISLTMGSSNSGISIQPFRTADFELDTAIFHDRVFDYGILLSRRIVVIVTEMKRELGLG